MQTPTSSDLSAWNKTAQLTVYGTSHAVIDAICAGVLLSLWKLDVATLTGIGWLFVFYNILAFGVQPVFGIVLDHVQRPRLCALAGCLMTAGAAVGFERWPLLAVTLAGIGNALFHLGAGTICLNLTPGRATAPGIFVAPGAFGIFLGTYLGKNGQFVSWPFLGALVVLCVAMMALKLPTIDYRREQTAPPPGWATVAVASLLVCVVIRSLVGMGVDLPWKSDLALLMTLTLAVVLGKGLGGVLADRFGWAKVAVGALVVSMPLLAFFATRPSLAIFGMFLFNITMPVTLVATSNILPGRPAFAFGLTCLALEIGAWPTQLLPTEFYQTLLTGWGAMTSIFVAALALSFGLRLASAKMPDHCMRVRS